MSSPSKSLSCVEDEEIPFPASKGAKMNLFLLCNRKRGGNPSVTVRGDKRGRCYMIAPHYVVSIHVIESCKLMQQCLDVTL